MLKGSMVAIVTPFTTDNQVDYKKLRELVQWHIESGTNAIVPCGTTGESPTLSHDEHKKVIEVVIESAEGKVPVIAGTGSNSTDEAVMLTKHAKKAGACAALVITPYYNKPTQEGMYRHFCEVAKAGLPVVLYNVPGRTAVSLAPETVARLKKVSNIVAIKEASGSLDQVSKILSLCDITVLSGDDSLTMPMMAIGAKGVISVAANIVPKETARLVSFMLDKKYEEARALHYKLYKIFTNLFIETNPIPVKTAVQMMGLANGGLRLPLCEMSADNRQKLKATLLEFGLSLKE